MRTMKRAAAVSLIIALGAVVVLSTVQQVPALQVSARAQPTASPELLEVRIGALTLAAQIWRPAGSGPFPAVLFNHGSYTTSDALPPSDSTTLGPVFARHGYIFMWLHRQGTGLSQAQGMSEGDRMGRALQVEGNEGRNRVQLQLLDHEAMNEAAAALAQLRARPDADVTRIGVAGHSFGGALSLLMAKRDPAIRATVIFGGAAASWDRSAMLRERLLRAVGRMPAAALFVYAKNDYSIAPGPALAAEMQRLGRRHALKIYPPFGADARAAHNLVFQSVRTWEADVFAFLDGHLQR
jgi:dienelactone hydrolase